jgi:peroxiredoxin
MSEKSCAANCAMKTRLRRREPTALRRHREGFTRAIKPAEVSSLGPKNALRHTPHIQGEQTMTIQVGDKLPDAKFRVMTGDGLQARSTDEIFKGKKVALFAVPGAYTGTCHKMHLPSIFLNAYALKDKGVDTIAIVSVNDAFVMNAWKRDTDQRDEATFLADGNAEFTKAIGMELDASGNGLGIRSKRYSMLIDDGVVKKLNLEPAPGKVEVSGGDTLLGQL